MIDQGIDRELFLHPERDDFRSCFTWVQLIAHYLARLRLWGLGRSQLPS
jgi:hypothetical protein